MITRETIDKIFETSRIEEVIGDFVTLKKSGSSFKGLSPFVNEKTPSFMVSPSKQIFKDFSSGKGGNVVSFLMDHEQYTYPEALLYLAKKYNIEVEETQQTDEEKEKRSVRESLFLVNEFANQYFQKQLWEAEEGRKIGLSYFKERGFTDETIKYFNLGYSPNQYEAFTKEALSQSYQLQYLVGTGLTKQGDNQRTTDRFRGRVMFPIQSHTGRVLGFGGRTLQAEAKIAKYLNSPESEIYHKSKTLYGLYQAKAEIGKQDNCLLVEGYTDVISLHQSGIKNVVASSGTALTKDQISLIKRYTPNITILFDGDAAGIKASLRGIDMVLEEGLNVQVLLFPDGDDPDSYAKKVSDAELKEYIADEKQDFLRFKAKLLLSEAKDNPLEKSKAARQMVESIALIPDALQRNAYVQECATVLQMEERVLFSELAQIQKNIATQKHREQKRANQVAPEMEVVESPKQAQLRDLSKGGLFFEQEKALIWLMLNYGGLKAKFSEPSGEESEEEIEEEAVTEYIILELEHDEIEFENEVFQAIFKNFSEVFHAKNELLTADYFTRMEDSGLINVVVDLVTEKYEMHNWKSQNINVPPMEEFVPRYTKEAVLRLREKRIGKMILDIQNKLKASDNVEKDLISNIQSLTKLNQLRVKINSELNRIV